MVSLTPQSRSAEVTSDAMNEGLLNGAMVLFPSLGGLYAALQNPKFVKLTNWQSRTAMTIMPAFFVFALTSEHKLNHRMQEVAEENEHAIKSVEWAEKRHRQSTFSNDEQKLRQLYRQSVLNSGVQLVDTPELGMHHRMANYLVTNPFKIIAAIGVPAVAYIYYGRSGKNHLSFSLKILHTRVFGQFAVICTLLGVMGLKEYLDQSGRFITENEVEDKVEEMFQTRKMMMDRLEYQASQRPSVLKHRFKAKST